MGPHVESAVTALYAFARALKHAQRDACGAGSRGLCPALADMHQDEFLNSYLKPVDFTFTREERIPSLASSQVCSPNPNISNFHKFSTTHIRIHLLASHRSQKILGAKVCQPFHLPFYIRIHLLVLSFGVCWSHLETRFCRTWPIHNLYFPALSLVVCTCRLSRTWLRSAFVSQLPATLWIPCSTSST